MKVLAQAFVLVVLIAGSANAALVTTAIGETFESSGVAPGGTLTSANDLTWLGDINDFTMQNATWPTGPDFGGSRAVRSSFAPGGTKNPSTILTDVSAIFSSGVNVEWNIFFSGNSTGIGNGASMRRADFILLASNSSIADIEGGDAVIAYKLSIWDPPAAADTPDATHQGAALGDSISLWYSTTIGSAATIDRWQFVAGYDLPDNSQDLNQGWNLRVTYAPGGTWSFGHLNGALSADPTNDVTLLHTVVDNSVSLGGSTWYAGAGWESVVTGSDNTDFGFDNFRIFNVVDVQEPQPQPQPSPAPSQVPEPASGALLGLGMLALLRRRRSLGL